MENGSLRWATGSTAEYKGVARPSSQHERSLQPVGLQLATTFSANISTGSMVQNHGHYRRKRPSRGKLRGTCSSIAAAAMSRRDRAACHQPEREKGLEEAQYARYLPASSTRHRHCRPAATHLRFEMSGAVVPHY